MNVIKYFPEKGISLLTYVQSLFSDKIYLVGGAVRDIMMGIEPKDYDFCTKMKTEDIKESLRGKHRVYCIGERHGTIGFKVNGEMIEITTFRTESYNSGSRQPNVSFVKNIDQDLSRRDFTINAMAVRCDNFKLIDPFNGMESIVIKELKAVGNSKIRFNEDPLRILRAIRIASKYNLDIESSTCDRVQKMAWKLLEISKERWVQELDKILSLDGRYLMNGLDKLWSLGIFKYMIPELQLQYKYNQNSRYHDYDLHEHTSLVVSSTPNDIDLRWASLLHDVAKPFVRTENKNGYSNYINHEILGAEMAEKISRHLKFSNKRREYIVDIIKNHLNDDCILRQYDNMHKMFK